MFSSTNLLQNVHFLKNTITSPSKVIQNTLTWKTVIQKQSQLKHSDIPEIFILIHAQGIIDNFEYLLGNATSSNKII